MDNGQLSTDAQAQIENCLHICLQLCANLAIYINPFLPNTAKKMCSMMKVVDKMMSWKNAGSVKLLSVGYSLRSPELLFRKIENEEVKDQIQKLKVKSQNLSMENQSEGNQQSAISKQSTEDQSAIANLKSEI